MGKQALDQCDVDVATGLALGSFCRRQRHQEFLRFLKEIDQIVPVDLDIRWVMDNYGTHQVEQIQRRWRASAAPRSRHSHQRQLAQSG
jgi:hypothetical protein